MKLRYIGLGLVLGLMVRCANPIPPSGGDDDIQGPTLLTESSTPNYQVNFSPKEIVLVFDEWIELKSAQEQIIISPPLEKNPTYEQRGKEVRIIFDPEEELRPQTTYSIQFGEAIQDITEGNPTDQLKYVFSTGPKLDSLELRGRVLGVNRQTPVPGATIMLYAPFADSMPFSDRPAYTGKTNDQGYFIIGNLPADTFRIVALQDENRNYQVDVNSESLAFTTEAMIVSDSFSTQAQLYMYREIPEFKWRTKSLSPDKLVLGWRGYLDTSDIQFSFVNFKLQEAFKDSLIYWLQEKTDSALVLTNDGKDSLLIRRTRKLTRDTTLVNLDRGAMKRPMLSPKDTLKLIFDRPIMAFDSSKFLYSDTTGTLDVDGFSLVNNREMHLTSRWSVDVESELTILPEGIEGINGLNKDTIVYPFFIPNKEKSGNLILTFTASDSMQSYLVTLMSGDKEIKEMTISNATEAVTFKIGPLRPGKYEVLVVEDDNRNGRWDTGSYWESRQPEKKWKKELEPLRENWDLKVDVKL